MPILVGPAGADAGAAAGAAVVGAAVWATAVMPSPDASRQANINERFIRFSKLLRFFGSIRDCPYVLTEASLRFLFNLQRTSKGQHPSLESGWILLKKRH